MQTNSTKTSTSQPKAAFYNRAEVRSTFFQVLVFIGLAYFFYTIYNNTLTNMEARGIRTGFGFMSQPAGFDILLSLIPFEATDSYGRTFYVGLLNTLLVSAISIVLATFLGFLVGVSRLSKNWLVAKVATIFVETFRNIPLLLQIFFWYIAVLGTLPGVRNSISFADSIFVNVRGLFVPKVIWSDGGSIVLYAFIAVIIGIFFLSRWARKRQEKTGQPFPLLWTNLGLLIGLPLITFFVMGSPASLEYPELGTFSLNGGLNLIPELVALTIALSVYTAAFIAEAVRAGVQSVSHGQVEAAAALGLPNAKVMRLVTVPQALRVIVPPLNSQYQNLLKNSSLAMAIGYPDLVAVFMGSTLNQVGQAVEIVFLTMLVYLLINLTLSLFMNWYNARIKLVER
jgi:general L-amino acid transport system permease protein